jgi:hypothetical protein
MRERERERERAGDELNDKVAWEDEVEKLIFLFTR